MATGGQPAMDGAANETTAANGADGQFSDLDFKRTMDIEVEKDNELLDEDGHVKRFGNQWTAAAHIITAVIGSGVLSLTWGTAQMGWAFGPVTLLAFAWVTLYCSWLFADVYRTPDPDTGKRNHSYMEAVESLLGGWQVAACGIVQYFNLVGTAIGYTVTAGVSMVAVVRSDCFHSHPPDPRPPCHISNNPYMIIFGAFQLLFSQVPDFDRLWWLSILAAVMSFSYSLIGLGLSIGKATEHPNNYGSGTWQGVQEVKDVSGPATKTWAVFNGLGVMAFAYSFSNILIEVQDTIAAPPAERVTMKRATTYAIATTTLFYTSVGIIGYAAFGNQAPGNLLTGFGYYNPFWLVDIANICVVIHLLGAYQVYSQPWFAFVESQVFRLFPTNKFLRISHPIKVPILGRIDFSPFRLVWRSMFVVFTTVVAMLLPFFNDIVGLLGSVGFWPLTVYFPVEMYIRQFKVRRFSMQWIGMQSISLITFLVSLAGAIGSVEAIVQDLKNYTPFHTVY